MDINSFDKWCKNATAQIRYQPDRNAVTKELRTHLEDHYDALLATGLSPAAAEKKALAAMGSAEVLAPQLAAVHKPFWGYACSAVAWITVIIVLICLVVVPNGLLHQIEDSFEPEDEDFTQTATHYYERVFYDEPKASITCDNYTLRIEKSALWAPKYGDPAGEYYAAVQIKVSRWPTMPDFEAMDYFWAEDNLGTKYISYAEMTHQEGEAFVIPGSHGSGLLTQTYDLRLRGVPGPDIEWIDLHYDRDGREVTVHDQEILHQAYSDLPADHWCLSVSADLMQRCIRSFCRG